MRIAFITDLHIGEPDEKPLGVDVRANLLAVLAALPGLDPDCLIVGGDICNESGNRAIYEWVKEQLDKLPWPYYVIAGNHDESAMLAEVFRLTHHMHDSDLYYAIPLEGRPALFLDTAKGEISPKQWSWLREYLSALRDNNVLIAMHYPPLPADVRYMDEHFPFRQSDEFLQLIKELPCHVTVACGHYHVEKTVQRGNLLALLTPSTIVQAQHDSPEFTVDHYRPGIRVINLTTHGTNSTVHYLM